MNYLQWETVDEILLNLAKRVINNLKKDKCLKIISDVKECVNEMLYKYIK